MSALYIASYIAIGTIGTWLIFMIVIPVARSIAEFSMPPWRETAWKLAVIAVAVNVLSMFLDPVNGFLSFLVCSGLFWGAMVKWFDVDFFGAAVIVMVSWGVRLVLMGLGFAFLLK